MSAPVTLFSPDGSRSRSIAAIDAPGWIQLGWSASPVVVQPAADIVEAVVEPPQIQTSKSTKRNNDLPRDGVSEV